MFVRMIVSMLLITLATTAAAQSGPATVAPGVWRTYADRLPPGALVKLRLQSGERFTATLLQVDADALLLQPKTRLAVPPQRVAYSTIVSMEQAERSNAGLGKAIAIGVASGAATFVGLLMLALSTWD